MSGVPLGDDGHVARVRQQPIRHRNAQVLRLRAASAAAVAARAGHGSQAAAASGAGVHCSGGLLLDRRSVVAYRDEQAPPA